MFPRHVISRYGDIAWPARSPDLSAPDYILWRHLKAKVYANKLRTFVKLEKQIRDEITDFNKGVSNSCG
jgi:hypothetical protein